MKTEAKSISKVIKIIILITLFILVVQVIFSGFELEQLTNWYENAITLMYVSIISVVNVFFYSYIDIKLSWSTQGKKRVMVGILGAVVVTVVTYFFCRMVHLVFIEQSFTFMKFWAQETIASYLFIFFLALIIALAFHVFYFYKVIQETKVKEQKIIAGTASAKFDALKNQLDPHFLFNSLNVLTALIDENKETAQAFTAALSKVYRYVLEQKNKALVTVNEELKFAEIYMDLLKMRFENSIVFEMPAKCTNPEAKMVPLSLQLVLENAVKHNRVSEESPLHIKIVESHGNLWVTNTLQEKRILEKGSGIGLSNIKHRYALLTERSVEIYKTTDTFGVYLPILTKKRKWTKERQVHEEKQRQMKKDTYQLREEAKEKVHEIKSFYGNLTSYCIVIPFLCFVNYFTNNFAFPWVLFPICGWGIGIFFHYLKTFGFGAVFGKEWEVRKIKEYMNKH